MSQIHITHVKNKAQDLILHKLFRNSFLTEKDYERSLNIPLQSCNVFTVEILNSVNTFSIKYSKLIKKKKLIKKIRKYIDEYNSASGSVRER